MFEAFQKQDEAQSKAVATLAKRLDMLLAWKYDVLTISEVRASAPSLRTLARRARACGYFSSWSSPPPRVATFSVTPSGVAILAKTALALGTLKVPSYKIGPIREG